MATTNPTAHKDLCHFGGLCGDEKVSNNANATNPEIRAYSIGSRSPLSSTISTVNAGHTEEYESQE
jgi:hypothetical protein